MQRARQVAEFFIIEGLRTPERQRELVTKGANMTLRSRHLTGHGVDLAPVPLDWNNLNSFKKLAKVLLAAAPAEAVPLKWGGNFPGFFDEPHFELDSRSYP